MVEKVEIVVVGYASEVAHAPLTMCRHVDDVHWRFDLNLDATGQGMSRTWGCVACQQKRQERTQRV
jgi:hypothetical protein